MSTPPFKNYCVTYLSEYTSLQELLRHLSEHTSLQGSLRHLSEHTSLQESLRHLPNVRYSRCGETEKRSSTVSPDSPSSCSASPLTFLTPEMPTGALAYTDVPTLQASLSGTYLQIRPELHGYSINIRHWRGALFISAQLSTDTVSALRKVWLLIRLWKQHCVQACT